MSMPPPFSAAPSDEVIPAADPGAGAPPPSPGFGIGGEDPDVLPATDAETEDADEARPPAGGAAQPKRPEM